MNMVNVKVNGIAVSVPEAPSFTYTTNRYLSSTLEISAGAVICLDGDLGVGKTVFAQGFGAGSRCDHFITFILKKLLKPLKQQRIIID